MKIQFVFDILLGLLIHFSAWGYDSSALTTLEDRVVKMAHQGRQPVVIFDLDDTLINTRERTVRILKEIARTPAFSHAYPREADRLNRIKPSEVRYEIKQILTALSIYSAAVEKVLATLWNARFFTNEYCRRDESILGGVDYVWSLFQKGAKIFYLTGRDVPRMEDGTGESLHNLGFPMGVHTKLLMKPNQEMTDLEYKQRVFQSIQKEGDVVGVFENEPANLNAMADAFPKALPIFLDTIHSNHPAVPTASAVWIKNFERR